ncbi:predicted protein [Nematostella vectensis]|uniref:Opine dehydrogenase domain-containing protein n=1 Tax=Nematostella vectensis TaxID=45351 RepID=A7RLH1_NEMVE|nr:predicted protein [Nematostella vectensis]|eukprot:XP_001639753.1 predicted protein [Nematostella vectensis]
MSNKTKVVICGGGNGAHALAGVASADPGIDVSVLTLYADEADRWNKEMQQHGFKVTKSRHGQDTIELTSKPNLVTKDPLQAIPGSDIIILIMPAFAHGQYLHAMKPFMKPGMVVVALPSQGGFVFEAMHILGKEITDTCTFLSFESLPWACRLKDFGSYCEILGTKASLAGAYHHSKEVPAVDPLPTIQRIMGEQPVLKVKGHVLAMSLMAVNAYIHPSILYDRWVNWDGKSLQEAPLFYQGATQSAADLLSDMSNEALAIAKEITRRFPEVDMSQATHIHDWYLRCYPDDITDKSTLKTTLQTNVAYRGLVHPMTKTEEGLVPTFKSRYTLEDIPYGLVVIKGLAELFGVPTPQSDKVLLWIQEKAGKEYLVDGKLQGRDVKNTGAPQRFGITDVQELMKL